MSCLLLCVCVCVVGRKRRSIRRMTKRRCRTTTNARHPEVVRLAVDRSCETAVTTRAQLRFDQQVRRAIERASEREIDEIEMRKGEMRGFAHK